jgi:hypothetical protein
MLAAVYGISECVLVCVHSFSKAILTQVPLHHLRVPTCEERVFYQVCADWTDNRLCTLIQFTVDPSVLRDLQAHRSLDDGDRRIPADK